MVDDQQTRLCAVLYLLHHDRDSLFQFQGPVSNRHLTSFVTLNIIL